MEGRQWRIGDYNKVLVVEGYSDLVFFSEFLKVLGLNDGVFIKELHGRDGLERKIETLVTPALLNAKTAIGFIVDANGEPSATRQSLCDLVRKVTGQVVTDGRWTTGKPRIGVFVVPGGDRLGEIETLVWESWSRDPANVGQKRCVESYVECMERNGIRARSRDKGLIGTFLAVRNDEDPRLGPGARSRTFDLGRPEFAALRGFLEGFR